MFLSSLPAGVCASASSPVPSPAPFVSWVVPCARAVGASFVSLRPSSRSFSGGGLGRSSGTWGSVCFALGRGRRVLLWLPSGCLPPSWSGVSWSSAGGLDSAGCWWLGVAVTPPVQLSLF